MNKKKSQTSRSASFSLKHFSTITAASASLLAWFPQASAADVTKANNTTDLNLGTSWALGTAPTSSDVAVWNDTVVGANSSGLGAAVNWQGIRVEGSTQTGLITADLNTFGMTLGSAGIDLSASPRNFSIREGTFTVGANQTWNVGTGRTLSVGVTGGGTTLAGSGNVNKTGSGTLNLTAGTNTYSGNLTISEGTLLTAGTLMNNAGNLYLSDGARIENGSTAVSTVTTGNAAAYLSGNVTFVGTNGGIANTTRLSFLSSAGAAINLLSDTTVNIANATVGPTGGGGRVTFSGIAGSSSHTLTKTGIGTLVIEGTTTTYNGNVFVSGGQLFVNNSSGYGLGTGAVTVTNSTLGGTGNILGNITIGSGGTLTPGSLQTAVTPTSTFVLQSLVSGSITFNSGSAFSYHLDSSATLSTGASLQVVTGDLNLNGTVTLSLSNIDAAPDAFSEGTTFSLLNYTGTWNDGLFRYNSSTLANGSIFSFNNQLWQITYDATSGGSNFTSDYRANSSFVNITAVPEPNAIGLLAAGLTLLTVFRKRKQS